MHISEGILSGPVLLGGAVFAAAGVARGLREMDDESIPRTAVVSAAFFVASLIHVPMGFTSAHLVLIGLAGAMLGWRAFPALLVALALQAVLFGFGGLTTLGVNTVIMAGPAVFCGSLFRQAMTRPGRRSFLAAGACGALAVLLGALLAALALGLSHRAFHTVAWLLVTAHAPVMVVEFVITGAVASFLNRVKPDWPLDRAGGR